MTAGDGPWQGAATAALSWDVDDSPYSDQFGDMYYSPKDGLAESCHVFLIGNGLLGRWQDLDSQTFTIAETGFGTGLNFLATWELWCRSNMENKRLHYVSIEKFPLEEAALRRALAAWPALAELSDQLLRDYPPPLPGCHRLLFDAGRVCLDLVIEDVAVALTGLEEVQNLSVDAWYLDGFAPARNPAMWTGAIFRGMAQLSHSGTVFSTFTAAGDVRRGLQEAGFTVEKIPGFGRKREMLRGEFTGEQAPTDYKSTPWHIAAAPVVAERTAIVLGAGLAGAGVAAALAGRGKCEADKLQTVIWVGFVSVIVQDIARLADANAKTDHGYRGPQPGDEGAIGRPQRPIGRPAGSISGQLGTLICKLSSSGCASWIAAHCYFFIAQDSRRLCYIARHLFRRSG